MAAPIRPPDRGPVIPVPPPRLGPPPGHPATLPPPPAPTFLGPPGSYPNQVGRPYPGYMTPAEQLAFAQKQAELFYAPTLAEAAHQQRALHDKNLSQQATIQAVYKALTGMEPGPYGDIAGHQGFLDYVTAVQQGNQAEQDLASKVLGLKSDQGSKAQEFLTQEQSDQQKYEQDRQSRAISLYNAGFATQRDVARELGFPNPNKYPDTLKSSAASPHIYGSASGGYFTIDPASGKVQEVRPPIEKPTRLQVVGSDKTGRQLIDPYTGQVVTQLSPPVKGSAGAGSTKPTYRQGADGRTYLIDPKTKTATPVAGMPGKTAAAAASPALIAKGWKVITASKAPGWAFQGQPITISGLRGVLSDFSKSRGFTGKNGAPPPITVADLPRLTDAQKSAIGISQSSGQPQDVYLQLVHMGIPARRAWGMVRKQYPKWGQGYFQGSASQTSAVAPTNLPTDTSTASRQIRGQYSLKVGKSLAAKYGWGRGREWNALVQLWSGESGWDYLIPNQAGSGAYGIPQALPASKMASAGADWQTNPATQIKWGLKYIKDRYGSPSRALAFWNSKNPHWY